MAVSPKVQRRGDGANRWALIYLAHLEWINDWLNADWLDGGWKKAFSVFVFDIVEV